MQEHRPRLWILWTQTATHETILQDETTALVSIVSAFQSQKTHGQTWVFKMRIEAPFSLLSGAFIHVKFKELYHASKNLIECTPYLLCENNGCKTRGPMLTQLRYLIGMITFLGFKMSLRFASTQVLMQTAESCIHFTSSTLHALHY